MATYDYEGVNIKGAKVKGSREALSKQKLVSDLRLEGIFVSTASEKVSKSGLLDFSFNKSRETTNYFFQLSLLLKSGIALVQAQNIIVKTIKNDKLKNIILKVTEKVNEGVKFSDALALYPSYYDPMYINLIKVSESVGRLPDVLMDIAEYEEKKRGSFDKLISAVTYPLIIAFFGIIVLVILLTVVVPKIETIFINMKQELPLMTKIMLSISSFVIGWGPVLIGLLVLVAILLIYLYRYKANFRYFIDKKLYNINIVSYAFISRFSNILSFQLREGIVLTDALNHVLPVIKNVYMRKKLEVVRRDVQEGVKFSASLKEAGIFHELLPAAASVGESSGNLPDLLDRAAQYYDKQLSRYTDNFLAFVEPVLIALIGVSVAFVLISIMTPLFDMQSFFGEQ